MKTKKSDSDRILLRCRCGTFEHILQVEYLVDEHTGIEFWVSQMSEYIVWYKRLWLSIRWVLFGRNYVSSVYTMLDKKSAKLLRDFITRGLNV